MSGNQQMLLAEGASAAPPSPGVGGLYGWGYNYNGSLDGITPVATAISSPSQIGALTTWRLNPNMTPLGNDFTLITKTDGTLWGMGNNSLGQLGMGNTTNLSVLTQVGALSNWSFVSCSNYIASAIKTDGTLWVWGQNLYGSLGLGNTTYYSSPKQVGASTTWANIAIGAGASNGSNGKKCQVLAVTTDNKLFAWGFNGNGELGLGDTINRSSPVQVGALTNWAMAAAGCYCSFAVKTDGTLWAWGDNNQGQLGIGTTVAVNSPVQVGALTTWAFVACNRYGQSKQCTYGITTGGALFAWGNGSAGALGLGNLTSYSSPKQVGTLTNWSKIGAGATNTAGGMCIAIKTDGTLWSWGTNDSGILGLGVSASYSSPKQIGALTTWTGVNIAHATAIGTHT